MKRQFVICSLCAVLCSLPSSAVPNYPAATGFVTDTAGILDAKSKADLEAELRGFEVQTSNEIFVATIPSLQGESIETYAVKLFKQWGIGKKGKDNGVLILVAVQDRKMRIEVGYGLESRLPDGLCGQIIAQDMRPAFKAGHFSDGIRAAAVHIMAVLHGGAIASPVSSLRRVPGSGRGNLPLPILLSVFSLFIGLGWFMFGVGAKSRTFFPMLWGSLFGGIPLLMSFGEIQKATASRLPYAFLSAVAFGMLYLGMRAGKTKFGKSMHGSTTGGGWSFGGGGGGSGGSGGGGGGGGSSGGGGASGGW